MAELAALRLQARPVKTQNPPLVCLVCRFVAALSAGGRGTLVKGTNKVRWEDAMEFCSCPSLRTGRTYTLPGETTQVGVFPANPWITQPKTKTRADFVIRASDWWWLA